MSTFWLSRRVIQPKSWPMFMLGRSFLAMGFRFPLFLIEMFCSFPIYGRSSTRNWAQGCISTLHIIRRPMARASGLYRPWSICCGHVLLILVGVGIPTYLLWSWDSYLPLGLLGRGWSQGYEKDRSSPSDYGAYPTD